MHKTQGLKIKRYPASTNRSLQAWSAADEHILLQLKDFGTTKSNVITYGDSFGYLTAQVDAKNHYVVVDSASQQGAISKNIAENKVKWSYSFLTPLAKPALKPTIGLMKIPKSLDLFELFLDHFTQHASVKGQMICSFMTRHFSKQMVEISVRYFDDVSQSKAIKKSRLLVLKTPKKREKRDVISTYSHENDTIRQYFGVFSSNSVDHASELLMQNLPEIKNEMSVLDLGCGNGIIGKVVLQKSPKSTVHFVDDSYLALESAKLNVGGDNTLFHHLHTLDSFAPDSFDVVLTNPPFHIEHEIDISLPIRLFKESHRILKPGGELRVVANHHLNYKTHLDKVFKSVEVVAENEKYIVYSCVK